MEEKIPIPEDPIEELRKPRVCKALRVQWSPGTTKEDYEKGVLYMKQLGLGEKAAKELARIMFKKCLEGTGKRFSKAMLDES